MRWVRKARHPLFTTAMKHDLWTREFQAILNPLITNCPVHLSAGFVFTAYIIRYEMACEVQHEASNCTLFFYLLVDDLFKYAVNDSGVYEL